MGLGTVINCYLLKVNSIDFKCDGLISIQNGVLHIIKVCKWLNDALSPVLFFIDDLANVWVDVNNNGKIDPGEDWGLAKNGENSSFRFLNEEILSSFPYIKVTFFVPVGVRTGMIENSNICSVSKMINCDDETKSFFKSIFDNGRYEIAYHGTTHGMPGKTKYDFKQEWELFNNIEEAVIAINKGKEIYKEVFEVYPKGGKYCGYTSNTFSDESIEQCGFIWWCRYWNRGLSYDSNCLIGGYDHNPYTNFDIKTFGNSSNEIPSVQDSNGPVQTANFINWNENGTEDSDLNTLNKQNKGREVVDVPTTLAGNLFTNILNVNTKTIKGIVKKVLKDYLIRKKIEEIDFLLNNKLVISIQEHIAPGRNDGVRQVPNIFDDRESLYLIFSFLKDKQVWYCTGTELAEYYLTRVGAAFEFKDSSTFIIKNAEKYLGKFISIKTDDNCTNLKTPDNHMIKKHNNCFTFQIVKGIYKLKGDI